MHLILYTFKSIIEISIPSENRNLFEVANLSVSFEAVVENIESNVLRDLFNCSANLSEIEKKRFLANCQSRIGIGLTDFPWLELRVIGCLHKFSNFTLEDKIFLNDKSVAVSSW